MSCLDPAHGPCSYLLVQYAIAGIVTESSAFESMLTRSLCKQLQNLREICTSPRDSMLLPLVREIWDISPLKDEHQEGWGLKDLWLQRSTAMRRNKKHTYNKGQRWRLRCHDGKVIMRLAQKACICWRSEWYWAYIRKTVKIERKGGGVGSSRVKGIADVHKEGGALQTKSILNESIWEIITMEQVCQGNTDGVGGQSLKV